MDNASTQTYRATAASTQANSRYARPVFARSATEVTFPPQIALVGPVSDGFRLVQPITVNLEHDNAGQIIVSDEIFCMYGVGITRQDALRDYISSLVEYYEVLEAQRGTQSVGLFLYLQSYLRPIL